MSHSTLRQDFDPRSLKSYIRRAFSMYRLRPSLESNWTSYCCCRKGMGKSMLKEQFDPGGNVLGKIFPNYIVSFEAR
jgi:hypothetical protein